MQKIKSQKGSVTLIVIVTMLFLITFLMATYVMISNKAQTSAEITAQIKEQYNNLEEEGSVNENSIGGNVIPIYTKEQLVQMGNGQKIYIEQENKYYTYANNGYYILKNNIDVNEGNYTFNDNNEIIFNNDAEQWTPFTSTFTGILDGMGHNIYGLYIENSGFSTIGKGLFSQLNVEASIKNLGIENSYILGYESIGAFAGINYGKIENCYNNGIIISNYRYVGGITGQNLQGATIKDSYNLGNITKVNGTVYIQMGGIAGQNAGNIQYSYNLGLIKNSDKYGTGGIVGNNLNTGVINYCYNSGRMSSDTRYIGGIAGQNAGILSNSYNISNIEMEAGKKSSTRGGICGENTQSIINCYNIGNIKGYQSTGGITGNNTGTLSLCYNKGDIEAELQVGGISANNSGIIERCNNEGYILGEEEQGGTVGGRVGGIIGLNTGTVKESFNLGEVYGIKSNIGGIVGTNQSNVIYCYNMATVKSNGSNIGGIAGNNQLNVICCYNMATVESNGRYIGGITGYNGITTSVTNCYNVGTIQGIYPSGAISGGMETGSNSIVTNCYYINTLTLNLIGKPSTASVSNCSQKTEIEMKVTDGSFIGLLNTNILPIVWKEDINNINNGYPILNWQETNT